MKLLFLGNSNDNGDWFEGGGKKRHQLIAERLETEFGEPVEVMVRAFWPNQKMITLLSRWLDEFEPDAVFMNVTTFPFAYESTPLRVKRILGRLGPSVGDAGERLASSKRWSHNAAFRTARSFAQATIGGDTNFTCDEVLARAAEAIRIMARREGMLIIVKGPHGRSKQGWTGREHRRKENKRLYVHRGLERICEQQHVAYRGNAGEAAWRSRPMHGSRIGDGLHSNAEGHRLIADDYYDLIHDAWADHLAADKRAL